MEENLYLSPLYYYCCCLETGREGVVAIPRALGHEQDGLCNSLYDLTWGIGYSAFDSLSVAMDLLEQQKPELLTTVTEEDIAKRIRLPSERYGYALLPFLVKCFQHAESTIETQNSFSYFTKKFSAYIERLRSDGSRCSDIAFQDFCRKERISIKQPEIISVDLRTFFQENISLLDFVESRELLLSTYPLTLKEKAGLRERFLLEGETAEESVNRLNHLVKELAQNEDLIITYHLYSISTLRDLFVATFQELCRIEAKIKECQFCKGLFIPSKRIDTKYCSRPSKRCNQRTCGEQVRYVRDRVKECQGLYDRNRKRISAKAKTDPDPAISDFYKAYYTKKTQVLEDKISVEEYRTWLETYQE